MNEQVKKVIISILIAAVFVLCIALVVIGQRHIGLGGLGLELLGLAGLLFLLWLYNYKSR